MMRWDMRVKDGAIKDLASPSVLGYAAGSAVRGSPYSPRPLLRALLSFYFHYSAPLPPDF